jgi:hypothetical protein
MDPKTSNLRAEVPERAVDLPSFKLEVANE